MTIPDLRDEIIIIILQILDVETAWLMVVLKGWKAMSKQGKCREFFEKCLNVGNVDAVYFEGVFLATHFGDLDDVVAVSEANVSSHT
ncbi:unnamed protein product [Brassica rapa]|uniref:Uncharacterized protein n=1 Tax=Brassica campestris TaxID=3711 RepID=A0A8D9DHB5_BRACM|nr:unnamed protein product [Brassica rapa]